MSPRAKAAAAKVVPAGMALAPGAGSSRDHPSLRAIEAAVAPLPVRRFDFPYRKAGRKAPDRPPVLLAAVHEEAASFAAELGVGTERLVLGGRSMGGRICSMAIADGLPAAGLVAISYPLHPPGRPDRLRTEHLPRLSVPCLFVSGTADTFGTPAELEAAFALIPGPVTTVWIDGGRHELKNKEQVVAEAVTTWLAALGTLSSPAPRARTARGRSRTAKPPAPAPPGGDPQG